MKVTAAEYPGLKIFFTWMCQHALGDPRPALMLHQLEQAEGKAVARQGLTHGLGDIVEGTHDVDPVQIARIDAELARLGVITLSDVRGRYWKRLPTILKRGRLKDENEYRALKSLARALPETERGKADALLTAFEAEPALPLKGKT